MSNGKMPPWGCAIRQRIRCPKGEQSLLPDELCAGEAGSIFDLHGKAQAGARDAYVHVYYGVKQRWDNDELERSQEVVREHVGPGRHGECFLRGFDAIQADFEFNDGGQAQTAFLALRAAGFLARHAGMGEGPPAHVLEESRRVMRSMYERYCGNRKG